MVLNVVSALALTIALGFLSTNTLKADDFLSDVAERVSEDISNVLPDDNPYNSSSDDSDEPGTQVYSLDNDDEDDFD